MNFCPKCGKELPEVLPRFCPLCGQDLTMLKNSPQQIQTKLTSEDGFDRRITTIAAVTIAIVLVGLAVSIYYKPVVSYAQKNVELAAGSGSVVGKHCVESSSSPTNSWDFAIKEDGTYTCIGLGGTWPDIKSVPGTEIEDTFQIGFNSLKNKNCNYVKC